MKKAYNRGNKFHTPWVIERTPLSYYIYDCDGDFVLSCNYRDVAEHIVALATEAIDTPLAGRKGE